MATQQRETAARLTDAANLFATGAIVPVQGALFSSRHGIPYRRITPGNRRNITRCCVLGAVIMAGWDANGAPPNAADDPWYQEARTALRRSAPDEYRGQPSVTTASDCIVLKHGPAQAAAILADWLNRAASQTSPSE